jgi:hypothetical protein
MLVKLTLEVKLFTVYNRPACHPRDVLDLVSGKAENYQKLIKSLDCKRECEQV